MTEGSTVVELGIGGLLAITVLKTVLPYVKPAKNGQVGKELKEAIKPAMDTMAATLQEMSTRDAVMASKLESDHKCLKEVHMGVHDINKSADQILRQMPKRRSD